MNLLLKRLLFIMIISVALSGCSDAEQIAAPERSETPSQPENSPAADKAEAGILQRNFDDLVEPVPGWQKSIFKVISDSETIYSEDKIDGTASRLASYNWDTKQSAVIWEGKARIISIELVPVQEDVQELHFARAEGDSIRWFKFSKGEVQELTEEQTANRYNRKLWFPDGQRYLYLKETGKSLGDGAGPEKVPAIYDVKQKKETILPFEKGFWSSLQWMKPGETVLAGTGYDDIMQARILNVKDLTEYMILNTDKIGDTHVANNPSRHQALIVTEGKVRLYTDHAEQIDVRHQLDYSQEKFTTGFYSFSPDGNKLVYTQGSSSGGSKVFIADGDATNLKTLTNDEWGILHLEWTLSSRYVIAAFQIPNAAEIFMGRIDISKAVVLDNQLKDKESLFPDEISYFDGTERLDGIEGNNIPAHFKRDDLEPYGFYIPESMEEYKFEDGTAWGMNHQRVLLKLFRPTQVDPDMNDSNPDLEKYKEYMGTQLEDNKIYHDYFYLQDRDHYLVFNFRYFAEDRDEVLPLLLDVIRTIRYVGDVDSFEPGIEFDFPKSSDDDENAVFKLMKKSMDAIVTKDKAAFRATLEKRDGEYFDYLIDTKKQFRFFDIYSIDPYDPSINRKNIAIRLEYLENGVVKGTNWMFTARKAKDGSWKIAAID